MPDPLIVVEDLHKSYGQVVAVAGVSFQVERGEVFALLGPNGAGKTTTVEVLEGYRRADRGTVRVLGTDPAGAGPQWRDRVGIVLQASGVEQELTVGELLSHFAGYYSRPRTVEEVAELAGLIEKMGARIKTLSGGQRRRLDLALALIGNPELVFLDEPTTGFDPAARRNAWEVVRRLSQGGTTVLLTTHYLEEAQQLADRVAVISQGVLVAEGDPDTLGGRHRAAATIRFRLPAGITPEELAPHPFRLVGELVEITTTQPTSVLAAVTARAVERGLELEGLEVTRPSLEDVYLQLVGGEGASE